jgi:hypothetical protein
VSDSAATTRGGPLRVAFLLRNLGYVRLFDVVIRGLLARGHEVHVLLERPGGTEGERAWLAELEQQPGFTVTAGEILRRDAWLRVAAPLRRLADYVWYLGPAYRHMPTQVGKAAERVDVGPRELVRRISLRSERLRRWLWAGLRTLEDAVPPSPVLAAELRALDPDVLVVVPHLMPGNRHSEYVRVARAIGLPTCMCIASWDNLTTKQPLREVPDRVLVWNDVQRREAVDLHGVPWERVAVTGAQSFDAWFERTPRPREEFCRRVGLDPDRPYVLYLGGALFRSEVSEAEFVRDVWLPALRADERLAGAGVLIRPHPRRLPEWDPGSFDGWEDVAVWPRVGAEMPVDEESRADFYDSVHHSAVVVGVNTTAMIEAAAIGRSVHTIFAPDFAESQETVHFKYLLTVGGGLLDAATTPEEHHDRLARALAGDAADDERRRRFLETFVRPYGLDEPALPRVLDEIEAVAAEPVSPGATGTSPLRTLFELSMASARAAAALKRRVSRAPTAF